MITELFSHLVRLSEKIYKLRFRRIQNSNRAIVMGILGRDLKTKQFSNGGSITTFSVATLTTGRTTPQANANRLQSGTESPPATD